MKKLLILLSLIPLLCAGQLPQTNLQFRWVSGYQVIGSDTCLVDSLTGLGSTRYKITFAANQLTNINNGYINTKSLCLVNGWPVSTIFPDSNFVSTSFYELRNRTINVDSVEILPDRLESIAKYTTPQVTTAKAWLYNYFNIPFQVTAAMETVGPSGREYTTTAAAVTAAAANDTIVIYGGTYNPATSHIFSKTLTVYAVGAAILRTSAAATYTVQLSADNVKLHGFQIQGNGANQTAVYVVQKTGCTVENNYITGHSNFDMLLRGTATTSVNTAQKNVFISANTNATIRRQLSNVYIYDNYGCGTASSFYEDASTVFTGYFSKILYNKIVGTYSTLYPIRFQSSNINVSFNYVNQDTINYLIHDLTVSDAYQKNIRVRGNNFIADKTDNAQGFIRNINRTLTHYTILDNTVNISDQAIAIYLVQDSDLLISGNTITIDRGSTINALLADNPALTLTISNNNLSMLNAGTNASFYNISVLEPTIIRDFACIISGNVVKNSRYFGQVTGGHACIFVKNVPNTTIYNNYFIGTGEGGAIMKGYNGTTSGIYSEYILHHNVFIDANLIVKGARNATAYNNSFYNDRLQSIRIFREGVLEDSDSATIINNAIHQAASYPIYFDTESFVGVVSNNNVIYGNADTTTLVTSTVYNWAGWQVLGQDANSYNSNPMFESSSQLWPTGASDAIGGGLNLGAAYKTGLTPGATWPNPATKIQGTMWTISAYVVKPVVVQSKRLSPGEYMILFHNGKILAQ